MASCHILPACRQLQEGNNLAGWRRGRHELGGYLLVLGIPSTVYADSRSNVAGCRHRCPIYRVYRLGDTSRNTRQATRV